MRVSYPLIPWIGVTAAGFALGAVYEWPQQRRKAWLTNVGIALVKYPPSLLFLLMTLGPILLLLRIFENGAPRRLQPANVFGRVPMFNHLLQFSLIHSLAVAYCYLRYGAVHWMFESPTLANYPFTAPPGWGVTLPETYLVWAFVVVLLYPVCRWFAGVKRRSKAAWLSYL